ncbi:hypothetical protein F5Y16DRAFT_396526 [Xylariaceae sp. FL0255]|nr:hypothetical protein F5Y16DRAFT_396526 [Xylariaceae sp. FL0255]
MARRNEDGPQRVQPDMPAPTHDSQTRPIYKKLQEPDSIRLFLLQPSLDKHATICGTLLETTLQKCNADLIDRFTALSYVWGETSSVEELQLDGSSISTTRNLATALRENSVQDRNQQVKLMDQIYSSAGSTVIYLGPMTANARMVFDSASSDMSLTAKKASEKHLALYPRVSNLTNHVHPNTRPSKLTAKDTEIMEVAERDLLRRP